MQIFSHSVGCYLVQLMVVFVLQKIFRFMRPHLLIIDLRTCSIGVLFRMSFPMPKCSSLFPTFSPFRFSLSAFMFRPLIHLDSSVVHGDKYRATCVPLHAAILCDQHHLLEILSFPECTLCFFIRSQVSIYMWTYIWAFISIPLIIMSVFMSVPHGFLLL